MPDKSLTRIRLQRLVDDLGSTLLKIVEPAGALDTDVTGVTIFDPHDEPPVCAGELVLGVGLRDETQTSEVIARLAPAKAAALVVKGNVSLALRERAWDQGVPLIALTPSASWFHLAVLLQALLERWLVIDGDQHGTSSAGDLFAFANAVSTLVDAPITVEDQASRVLAFSGRQEEADPGRIETVLGRRMPQGTRRMLQESGVFRELHRSRDPIYVPGPDESVLPRVAVAIRAGEEVLGSLWAVVREPWPEDRMRALATAADMAALHLLRRRSALDLERRLNAELLQAVFDGGQDAVEAASRLGLREGSLCVLAGQPLGVESADHELASRHLAISLSLHLRAIHPRSAVAWFGGFVYAVISVAGCGTQEQALRRVHATASDFVSRMGDRNPAVIGVGGPVPTRSLLGRARAEAESTVRVLREGGRGGAACFDDVFLETVLDKLDDVLAGEDQRPRGPVARLLAYDEANGADLTTSLRAYLDAFGDVIAAAAVTGVHPNTFRYRLRRIREVGDLDLDDPRSRLAALVQLATLQRRP
jgi:hypothetical protein